MSGKDDAVDFARKRTQAERNIKTRIDDVLSNTAEEIAKAAENISLLSSEAVFRQMVASRTKQVMDEAENTINGYIRAYSKVAISVLGDKDTGATGRLLSSELFGKTFEERSHTYMQYFFNDVVKIIIAGKRLKMKQSAIESSVKSQYADPYTNGVIEQANRKGANIEIPSYGHGIYHSAYGNIVRNAQGTIAIAWGREGKNHAKRNGAIGFYVYRGSSYPCDICDEQVGFGLHPMDDKEPPYHARCCCIVEYIFKKE